MLLVTHDLPVSLEVLNGGEQVISHSAALLRHLDGESAILTLASGKRPVGFHWGARVRFWIPADPHCYEVTGMVVGWERQEQTEPPQQAEAGAAPQEGLEALLRLWECRLVPQRRRLPRRRARFTVRYCALPAGEEASPLTAQDLVAKNPGLASEWQRAWCADIGGGGMRLRTNQQAAPPERVALHFTLTAPGEKQTALRREFCLQGRVLRAEPLGKNSRGMEMAVRFERLSVEEGMALSSFLTQWNL